MMEKDADVGGWGSNAPLGKGRSTSFGANGCKGPILRRSVRAWIVLEVVRLAGRLL